ncbi:hypothetical protein GCM10009865_06660 [Aeromicrobium ponti]
MSCGRSGTGETPQVRHTEEVHRPPRGSLSILERKSTSPQLATKYTKTAFPYDEFFLFMKLMDFPCHRF